MICLFIDVIFVSNEVLFVISVCVRVGRLLRVLLHAISVYVSVDGLFLRTSSHASKCKLLFCGGGNQITTRNKQKASINRNI